MLSKAPALLQYNSDTLAAKALELSPGFAAAQQQLQQGLGQQAAPGRAPAAASDPGSLGPAADQGAGPSPQPEGEATGIGHQSQYLCVSSICLLSMCCCLVLQHVERHALLAHSSASSAARGQQPACTHDSCPAHAAGLPLLAAAAVVRPEVLLLDSQRLLRRLQRLVTLVMGHPHWQQELLGAVETGRVAQWLVMGES
jgi:hypothetical protein